MSSDVSIKVENLSKCYQIYDAPHDRLKQFVLPRLQSALGMQSSYYFKEFWALNDVSLEVKKGETVGIIGRNGSGKSTLLQMICGTLNPTSGSINTNGRIAALLELGSGFNPEFTGRENVYLNASVLGLTKQEIDERFDEIERFADIGDFIAQPVKTYSSGMLVRLAFSVIAHVDADILVIDEALAVGDIFFTQKCMRYLRQFMETGTVIFVSHDVSSVKSLCDRVYWLESGKLMEHGKPKDVCEHYLEAFYQDQQGDISLSFQSRSKIRSSPQVLIFKDQRTDFINNSNLRNDIKVSQFNVMANSFGKGDAKIESVFILDSSGTPLSWVVGGELVTLEIKIAVLESIRSPIVGFYVSDRLGQPLFGDNTYITYLDQALKFTAGDMYKAIFEFSMPLLPAGNYSVTVAIAAGTQEFHVQQHWIHDAVLFQVDASRVATGLIGIPMKEIQLKRLGPA
jgi:lipopolysaccharide transport system ATP-binding protein